MTQNQAVFVKTLGSDAEEQVSIYPATAVQDGWETNGDGAVMHRPFNPPPEKDIVERALEKIGGYYTRDRDGKLYTPLSGTNRVKAVHAWYSLSSKGIFRLICLVDPPIPPRNVREAMGVCNDYHTHYLFGRLYVDTPQIEGEAVTLLWFESQLDISAGVSVDFLATFIQSRLATGCAYLAEPQTQKRLYGSGPKRGRKTSGNGKDGDAA
jgi:hypothetical protein